MMSDKRPSSTRRWFQFSLRTMFVGMTVACVVVGLTVPLGTELARVDCVKRHEVLSSGLVLDYSGRWGIPRPESQRTMAFW